MESVIYEEILVILFCIFVIGCIAIFYYNSFSITNDQKILEDKIERFITRGTDVDKHISIKQVIDIDNKKYVLFSLDNNLGNAELIRGLNSKYKIEFIEHGNSLFMYRVRKTSKSKYFVVFGKNHEMKLDNVKVTLDGHEYRINVPQQEYFIALSSVSDDIKTEIPQSKDFKLYDSNNIDVTSDVYKKLSR